MRNTYTDDQMASFLPRSKLHHPDPDELSLTQHFKDCKADA